MAGVVTVVRFTLFGCMAHFRRFYTNSSSLSYVIPPPPTIRGLVGAVLGASRSEYPDLLNDLKMAVRCVVPVRSVFQTVNNLYIKGAANEANLSGSAGRTQIPVELLMSSAPTKPVAYEILLVPGHAVDPSHLAKALLEPVYPPSLGLAFCLGWVDAVRVQEMSYHTGGDEQGMYLGALLAGAVRDLAVRDGQWIVRDRYPLRLDRERSLELAEDLLVERTGAAIACRYGAPWVEVGEERWAIIG